MIPICLILFILFIAVITIAIKKANAAQDSVMEQFWEREHKANSTMRKDTANLRYITIPEEFFPLNNDKINDLKGVTMVNLTGMSNTDLKLEYGVPNFKMLSEYDDNFTEFVRQLPDYHNRLIDAGYDDIALRLLEFAVDEGADSKAIYQLLANSYIKMSKAGRISELIEKADKLNSLSKTGIVSMLESLQADASGSKRDVPENIEIDA